MLTSFMVARREHRTRYRLYSTERDNVISIEQVMIDGSPIGK